MTEESTVNFADVYARIVTACVVTDCPENQAFMTPPVCGCVCVVSDMYCQEGTARYRPLRMTQGETDRFLLQRMAVTPTGRA